jgi:transcription initiation factor TFIIE subunit alpha
MVKKKLQKKSEISKKKPGGKRSGAKSAVKKVAVKEVKAPQQKFPDDPLLIGLLNQVAGEHGIAVARNLCGKELTDEELAKRTSISVNLVRRILYDLYDNRVVGYRRVRDEDSGWYIYYWRFEPSRALDYLNVHKRQLLQRLEEKLEQERNTIFFSCNNGGCPKVPFDVAVENDFKCPTCGNRLGQYDNSSTITTLEGRVQSLRQQLAES